MCGIFCSLQIGATNSGSNILKKNVLKRRGPNVCGELRINKLTLLGFVLWHQGNEICSQPFECKNIALLCNGDVFNIDRLNESTKNQLSDTEWVTNKISECKNDLEILNIFRLLEGPFSMIFYNKDTHDLYFCRDSLGRNSLIVEKNETALQILSTSYYDEKNQFRIAELPPLGLYKMNILNSKQWSLYPWSSFKNIGEMKFELRDIEMNFQVEILIKECVGVDWLTVNTNFMETFNFYELCQKYETIEDLFLKFLKNNELRKELETFSLLLENSVSDRVKKTTKYCKNCINVRVKCQHSKVAILFSGGIDCSILAVLADKYTYKNDPIDLINVAFQKVNSETSDWNVPDRHSGRDSYIELQKLCPSRKWNFVEVNVTRDELIDSLKNNIAHLIYPLYTVLDESIGSAFWFASRGMGICNGEPYISSARVVIVGSGADELFGGYVRHKNAYKRSIGDEKNKHDNVYAELEKDWNRIPSRNLARDDRIISDNGKTARAPFIEENLVKYVRSLSPKSRCCFLLEEGIGDKLFLRLYGYQLGLKLSVSLKKRAIQFGSRIANKNQHANDQSKYLNFIVSN